MDSWTHPTGRPPQPGEQVPELRPADPPPAAPGPAAQGVAGVPQQRPGEWGAPPPPPGQWVPPQPQPPPQPPPLPPSSGGAEPWAPPPALGPAEWSPPGPPPPPQLGGWPPPPGPPAVRLPRTRRGWPGVLALTLVLVLTVGVGVQTWQLIGVSSRLDRANQRLTELTQGQEYAGERLDTIEDRASELEELAGEAFDSEEIAAAVVPSVFMVVAGDFGGTAFAVGPETEEGGTNLFTNFHVIQAVWDEGGREVTLERTNQSYPAEILEVDPAADVAWLQTDTSFRGLATSTDEVRSGQPIIAVGAPLDRKSVV